MTDQNGWPNPQRPGVMTPSPAAPTQHELKTWPAYFHAVASGLKSFELRRDDRPFRRGDTLRLREWCPVEKSYTGREVVVKITYVMRKEEDFGLMDGFCLMGICNPAEVAARVAEARRDALREAAAIADKTTWRCPNAGCTSIAAVILARAEDKP